MVERTDDRPVGAYSVYDDLRGASNVLVQSPCFGGGKTRACTDLLRTAAPADVNALVVTCSYPAHRWLSHYQSTSPDHPHNLVVLGVGDTTHHSPTGCSHAEHALPLTPGEPVIDTIGNPADLTGLGIKITEYLRAFDEARYNDGPSTVTCCFDSLTSLLQYADAQRVYRFLDSLTTWIARSSATAHYHLDPDAHDHREIARFQPLFDAALDASHSDNPADWTLENV